MEIIEKIKAVLFYKNEPITAKEIVKILGVDEKTLKDIVNEYIRNNREGGLVFIVNDNYISLATNESLSDIISKLEKEEEQKPLTKASLETLSIIMYSGGITKPELDEIRGVNCSFILRNLMIRGLVEKQDASAKKRAPKYIPTVELLTYLGINRGEELEDFDLVKNKFEELTKNINKQSEGNFS